MQQRPQAARYLRRRLFVDFDASVGETLEVR